MNFVTENPMRRFLTPMLALFLLFAIAACEPDTASEEMAEDQEEMMEEDGEMMDEEVMMTNTIADVAMSDDRFSTLVTALVTADLAETLKGDGPFTVFAPTNAAFAKLPAGTLEDLMKPENKEKLRSILLYHVANGSMMADNVMTMEMIPSAQGSDVMVTKEGEAVMVGGANIVQANVQADNGVIHAIDTVLMPKDMMMDKEGM